MLFAPHETGLSLITSNQGASYALASIGTSVDSHASANTMGTPVELIADTLVTSDVFGICLDFVSGQVSGSSRQFLADLLIDPAGGTSYSTLVSDLLVYGPTAQLGAVRYYFPVWLKAGTTIGIQSQSTAVGPRNMRVVASLYGKPQHQWAGKVGQKVTTYGAVRASSIGTAITPGTSAMGSYTASLGTLGRDAFAWNVAFTCNDSDTSPGGSAQGYFIDVACGDATNKIMCAEHVPAATHGAEGMYKSAIGRTNNIQHIPAGANVYVRAACQGTPDASFTTAVYAVEN
jgi:hypothetical protein